MTSQLSHARQLRAAGQTYAQIGAALSLHRITVSRMFKQQLELARHRKYKGLHV